MPRMHKIGKTATSVGRNADGSITVRYHSTTVVSVDKTGRVTLDHGGWKTYTTKARMNQAANEYDLGFQVSQEKGSWIVWLRKSGKRINFDATPLSFKP